jgi:hypothetical protein
MLDTFAVPSSRPSVSWTWKSPTFPLKVVTVLCLIANPIVEWTGSTSHVPA